jgi:hypothetical protein
MVLKMFEPSGAFPHSPDLGGSEMETSIGPRELMFNLTEEEAFQVPSPRRTLCPRYEDCLDYAASRLWVSFTCRGCMLEELILLGILKELPSPGIKERKPWNYARLSIHQPLPS